MFYIAIRIFLLLIFVGFFFLIRPKSHLHEAQILNLKKHEKILLGIFLAFFCLGIIKFTSLNPNWTTNLTDNPHFQQYNQMASALLKGKLSLDIEVSDSLAAMENPYDYAAREEGNVDFQWDTAFFNGKYYMYFGIVPVLLLFLPLQLIGIRLMAYQATIVFLLLGFLALGLILKLFAESYSRNLSVSAYLSIFVIAVISSFWYGIKYPALYCTAIVSAICLALWGFYFSWRGLVKEAPLRRRNVFIALGALCSALTFGCRPTVGLFCVILVPLVIFFLRRALPLKEKLTGIIAFCLPFVVVAILLMLYNYARFANPFEFGQSYQLTVTDQTEISTTSLSLASVLNGILYHFLGWSEVSIYFPYIHEDGLLVLFPVLLLGCYPFGARPKDGPHVHGLSASICLSVILISASQIVYSPHMLRRYTSDLGFLVALAFCLGAVRNYKESTKQALLSCLLCASALYSLAIFFLLYFDYAFKQGCEWIFNFVLKIVL